MEWRPTFRVVTGSVIARTLLFVSTLLLASMASAQAGPEEEARGLHTQGVTALEAEQYSEASRLFRDSYARYPRAGTLCNLGLAYEGDGQLQAAAQSFRRCAAEDTSGDYRDEALRKATAIEAQLGGVPADPGPPDLSPQQAAQTVVQPAGPELESDNTLLVVGLVTAGVGVALVVVGAVIAAGAQSDVDFLIDQYPNGVIPPMSEDADLLDSIEGRASASTALYALGGALVVGGAVMMVLNFILDPGGDYIAVPPAQRSGLADPLVLRF